MYLIHDLLLWQVAPLYDYHANEMVNTVSQRMVEYHSKEWPTCRILSQRHMLRSIPVSRMDCIWKDKVVLDSVVLRLLLYALLSAMAFPRVPSVVNPSHGCPPRVVQTFAYWIYGSDKRLHAPAYPQACCACCTIL